MLRKVLERKINTNPRKVAPIKKQEENVEVIEEKTKKIKKRKKKISTSEKRKTNEKSSDNIRQHKEEDGIRNGSEKYNKKSLTDGEIPVRPAWPSGRAIAD